MSNKNCGWPFGVLLVTVLVLLSGISSAEEPRYNNPNLGISLPLTEDMTLYTAKHPGPFTFEPSTQFILVNKWKPSDLVMLNLSAVNDELELDAFKSQLEKAGMSKPGYSKVSVQYASIGENPPKRVVEHIFDLQGQKLRTMRQIYFVHRGQGLILVCTANADRFQETNQKFFEPFLRSIKFE